MNRNLPSPAVGLLRGETRVIVPSLVKELAGTIRKIAPREDWDIVDDLPERRLRASRLVEHFLKVVSPPIVPGSSTVLTS